MKNLPRNLRYSVSFCVVLLFAALLPLSTCAAVTEAWVQRYNSTNNGYEMVTGLAVDGSGNVIVTGFAGGSGRDFLTSKYAGDDGTLIWQRRNYPTNHDDSALALTLDSNDDVIVTGFSNLGDLYAFPADYYTAKYASADGALLWQQRYSSTSGYGVDFATAVAVDHNDDVIVTGSSGTLKYSGTNGALLWEQHLYSG